MACQDLPKHLTGVQEVPNCRDLVGQVCQVMAGYGRSWLAQVFGKSWKVLGSPGQVFGRSSRVKSWEVLDPHSGSYRPLPSSFFNSRFLFCLGRIKCTLRILYIGWSFYVQIVCKRCSWSTVYYFFPRLGSSYMVQKVVEKQKRDAGSPQTTSTSEKAKVKPQTSFIEETLLPHEDVIPPCYYFPFSFFKRLMLWFWVIKLLGLLAC